jgi:DNA-binding transcriptional ArsR family regulator
MVSGNLPFVETYRVLDALGDPTRRRILELLRAEPAAVGELARRLPVSRPAVSQHLRVLEDCGLVAHTAVGTRNVYRVAPEGLLALRRWLDELWGVALDSFVEYAEHQDASRRQ